MVRVTAGPTGTRQMGMSDCKSHRYTSDGERTERRLYDELMSDGRSHRHTANGERTVRRFMTKCRSSRMSDGESHSQTANGERTVWRFTTKCRSSQFEHYSSQMPN